MTSAETILRDVESEEARLRRLNAYADLLLQRAKRCVHMHKMAASHCGPEYTLIDGAGLEEVIRLIEGES